MKSVQLCLFVTLLVVVAVMADDEDFGCSANEYWHECGVGCQPHCYGPLLPPCDEPCKAGCICKPWHVRESKEGGECIKHEDCKEEGFLLNK
ncbi:cysteine-rich venom protein 6-like [Anopheles arabiensis]|uniref:Uncharacterized protein n=1 Tax=Anopheles arabiensis TaxID=7173 RepID=A0A1I8JTX9_ANOAR|nr:cysteine-rich venom protein 6-like [Anopheles arabiensis]